ncbi:MAG: hypothetical protein MJ177_00205 [Clostridia bacterium]|nr:hypothetical protein [Clostridia bacterium]
MADNNGSFSLDDILNDIKREREIKAGLIEQTPDEEKPQAEPDKTIYRTKNNIDELLEEYLYGGSEKKSPVPGREKTKYISIGKEDEAAQPVKAEGAHADNEDDGQMQIPGFSEKDPSVTPDIVSEEEAEQELIDRRKKRIDEFRVFAAGISDESLLEIEQKEEKRGRKRAEIFNSIELKNGQGLFDAVDGVEEKKKKKKNSVNFFLAHSPAKSAREKARKEAGERNRFNAKAQKKITEEMKTKAKFSAVMSGIITAVLVFLAALPHFYREGGALETLLGGSGRIYLGMNLALIILAVSLSYDTVRSSVKSIMNLTLNADTAVLIALFFSALHNIALLIKGGFTEYGSTLYNSAASFSLLLNSITKLFVSKRMEVNLTTLTKNKQLRSVQAIENRADAKQLAYGISTNGNPEILYSAETQIPENFSDISSDRSPEERFFAYAIPVILIVSVIAGIIGAIFRKDIFGFITGYTGCICICFPVSMAFISNYLILRCNLSACNDGSAILGYAGISDMEKTNAFIMDSGEIFYGEVSNFHTVKASAIMTEEAAITYTGAVLIKGNCVLSDVFAQIIEQQNIRLPAVEDLKYEDRLGFSAWVNDVKVLVGNRDMMTQHNVELPPLTDKERDGSAETGTMYVAVEQKLAAMFNVRYLMGKNVARQVRRLTDNGVVLMLMTRDPGITEEFVSAYAKIKSDSIKITNSKGCDIMRLYNGSIPRKKESGLICKSSSGSLLRLINAAFRLVNADRQASIIQAIGIICAAVISIAFTLAAPHGFLNPIFIIVYQIIWGVVSCVVSEKTLNKK